MTPQQQIEYNKLIKWVDEEATPEVKQDVKDYIDFLTYKRNKQKIQKAISTLTILTR